MTKTNVQPIPSNSQHHDTPNNKTHVIKFRVRAEEKASLELTCKLLNLSLSTFIRRAIHNVKIEKTVIIAGDGEETLTAVSTLLAQCSKVGGARLFLGGRSGLDYNDSKTAWRRPPVGRHAFNCWE